MKKTIFKITGFIFLIVLCISLSSCAAHKEPTESSTLNVDPTIITVTEQEMIVEINNTEKPTDKDDSWKQVYIDYLNNTDTENYEFVLVYVNEDEVPELYKHGKQRPSSSELCWIYENEVYSQWLMIDGFEYIERENLFMSTGVQSGVQGDFVYMINGNEAKQLSKGTASRMIQGQERYTWNGEDVSEDEYETLRKSAFDTAKATTVNEYHNINDLLY